MIPLLVLIGISVILFILFHLLNWEMKREGFENGMKVDVDITFCPMKLKTLYSKRGTLCCKNGESDANCSGCTLDPKGDRTLPFCSQVWQKHISDGQVNYCTADLKYFESKDGKTRGCSAMVTADATSALHATDSNMCKIYEDEISNYSKKNSCLLKKEASKIDCSKLKGTNCKIDIEEVEGKPAVIAVKFTDTNGTYQTLYTSESYKRFIQSDPRTSNNFDKNSKLLYENNIE